MRIGIVGHESAKFTREGEISAKRVIRNLLLPTDSVLVSGGCHLGGVDIWAEEEAVFLGRPAVIHKPENLDWLNGYKPRNLKIAEDSDIVYCLVVDTYPPDYDSMRFPYCYHCKTSSHIKSGGCWTARRAKCAEWVIIQNFTDRSTAPLGGLVKSKLEG